MSDSMLHSILQMPPELWSNDPIDIAQRHGRYLEASKRIIELERERDEARRECNEAQDGWSRALDERDEARKELAETISCIEQAIDFHQVHHQSFQASAIKNLLENINQRRKHDPI